MRFSKADSINLFKALQTVNDELENTTLTKNSKAYGYKYADISAVLSLLKPAMKKAGLIMTQGGDNGEFRADVHTATITTFVAHIESGEWLSTMMTIPLNKPTPQDYGAAVTYARRYSLLSIFGLVAEDDDASPVESEKRNARAVERETKSAEHKAEKLAQEQATVEKEAVGRVRQPRGSNIATEPVPEPIQTPETEQTVSTPEPKNQENEIEAGEIEISEPVSTPSKTRARSVTGTVPTVPKIENYSEEQFVPVEDTAAETESEPEPPKRSRPIRK